MVLKYFEHKEKVNKTTRCYRGVAQLVERCVRDAEVARSNRVTPTIVSVRRNTHFFIEDKRLSVLHRKPFVCFSVFLFYIPPKKKPKKLHCFTPY